jgi:phosphatidylserine/phosphatidylglycerophosphate/cardiolipin synthase-like enzyme
MGIKNTLKKHMDPHVMSASLQRLAVSVETQINPNHRHDEKWEQEQDRIRQEICDSHRYSSFANVRSNNAVKWYSDGHDYFWALSEILESAEECIYVSTLPERQQASTSSLLTHPAHSTCSHIPDHGLVALPRAVPTTASWPV